MGFWSWGRKKKIELKELVAPDRCGDPRAVEILRGWIVGQTLHVCLRDGGRSAADWGATLGSVLGHVANAFSEQGADSRDALEAELLARFEAHVPDSAPATTRIVVRGGAGPLPHPPSAEKDSEHVEIVRVWTRDDLLVSLLPGVFGGHETWGTLHADVAAHIGAMLGGTEHIAAIRAAVRETLTPGDGDGSIEGEMRDGEPAPDWDFYMCVWGEKETMASIRLDLALGNVAPDPERPTRVDVIARLRNPNPQGLTTNDEAAKLHEVENAIERAAAANGARVVAILTTDGRREWHVYGPEPHGLSAAIRAACGGVGTHAVELAEEDDPEWSVFRNLWPNALAWGFIQDRRVLANLESHGDDGRTPRPVTHYAYFPDTASRDRFVASLTDPEPTRLETHEDGQDERPCAAVFDTEIAPYGRIFALAESYRMAASAQGGEYDGWESPVVTTC